MKNKLFIQFALAYAIATSPALAGPPVMLSLKATGTLTWTSDYTNGIAVIQTSTNLHSGSWYPYFYALASNYVPVTLWFPNTGYVLTNYGGISSNNVRQTQLPYSGAPQRFYRIALQTNPPDPSLVLHLPFDNNFSNGVIVDVSGHNNHALQYSPTNWPGVRTGPDGSQAAAYGGPRLAPPPRGPDYTQGDYAGIPYSPNLDHLSNGTVLAWAYYDVTSYHNSTIVDNSCYGTDRGSWSLGRTYTPYTMFEIGIGLGTNDSYVALVFPDTAPGAASTGGWHYYGVTWDGTNIVGFFDGLPFATNSQAGYPELVIGAAGWTAIGCKIHGGTPQWDDADALPNWGWIGGGIDDVRIYSRPLSAGAIASLYASFDHQPPQAPTNLAVKVDSSTQVEIRFSAATDNFRVDGYRILRNGVAIVTNPTPSCVVDTGLSPNTSYAYTVQAFDPAGNFSSPTAPVNVSTPAPGGPVEVIVDNADGSPWVNVTGGPWGLSTGGGNLIDYWGTDFLSGDNTSTGGVVFRPSLPEPGDYSVYVWHPGNGFWYLFSANAPIDIVHGGTTNTVYVDEQSNWGHWHLIGTFTFGAGTNDFVKVRSDLVAWVIPADAFRFVK